MTESILTEQFRRGTKWYPKSWREKFENSMLETLVDSAIANGRCRSSRRELIALVLAAMFYRVTHLLEPIQQDSRNRAASISLALGASLGATGLVYDSVVSSRVEAVVDRFPDLGGLSSSASSLGVASVAFYGLWLIAGVFAIIGLTRIARICILVTFPLAVALFVASQFSSEPLMPSLPTLASFESLALIVAWGEIYGRRSLRLVTLTVAVVSVFLTLSAAISFPHPFYSYDFTPDGVVQIEAAWLVYVVPIGVLGTATLFFLRRESWAWMGVLALAPSAVLLLLTFLDGDATSSLPITLFIGCVALAIALMVLRGFGLRIVVLKEAKERAIPSGVVVAAAQETAV